MHILAPEVVCERRCLCVLVYFLNELISKQITSVEAACITWLQKADEAEYGGKKKVLRTTR